MKKLEKKDLEERLDATDDILNVLIPLLNNTSNRNKLHVYSKIYEYVDKLNWNYVVKTTQKN